jgi:glycosyltransferase involved in cell wall biosynthesis
VNSAGAALAGAITRSDRPRIAMALYGDLTYDSRVRKEARSLAEAGYDVIIVCLASGETRTDLPANVTILVRLPAGALVIPGSPSPFSIGRADSVEMIRRRVSWLTAYARGLRSWGRLAVEAAGPVDAWHAHDLTGLAAIAPSLRRGVPLVYDSHELYLESGTAAMLPRLARRILRYYEKRLISRVAALITVNDEIAAALVRRYRPRIAAVVHNCPVLATPWPSGSLIRDATGIPAAAPIVLYHGGLIAGRGIEPLMDALLSRGLEDIHLVLMGYGEKRDELRALALSEPWRQRLHVLDPVPPTSLLPWVASADIGAMVNPGGTLNDVYSSPNKLFECLAAGTPVVASDFPTLRRIVMDNPGGPLGTVCDPGNVEAIATSIRSILRLGPAEMGALRTRCRQAAEKRWNWDLEARTLLSVYANLGLRGLKPYPADTGSAGAE